MVSNKVLRKFFDKYQKEMIVSVPLIMQELDVSRPTATTLIQYLWENDFIEPVPNREVQKCYQVNI